MSFSVAYHSGHSAIVSAPCSLPTRYKDTEKLRQRGGGIGTIFSYIEAEKREAMSLPFVFITNFV